MAVPFENEPTREELVLAAGPPPEEATGGLILLHGRGGSAEDMLSLVPELDCPGLACLAPQAAGFSWYPYPFMAPLSQNEPWLSSGLRRIQNLLTQLEEAGLESYRVVLLGFSQGACLGLEYCARFPRRYGAVVGLSGGLIGPPGTAWEYPGNLDGTPVYLGCSDVDPHIPRARVDETARVLERLGGLVTERIYPNMGHTINLDEIQFTRELLSNIP
jgi:predicted esterase